MREGSGDAFAAAFELVATPAIFGFLGWLLDGRMGTAPIFTVAFVVIALAYASWRLAHDYGESLERAAWYGTMHGGPRDPHCEHQRERGIRRP
jgi:F0F1-type ATP synthase assembly protein I